MFEWWAPPKETIFRKTENGQAVKDAEGVMHGSEGRSESKRRMEKNAGRREEHKREWSTERQRKRRTE